MNEISDEKMDKSDSEKIRILHVEDNPDDQLIMKRSIDKNLKIDHDIVAVDSGPKGLEKLENESFDLLICDYRLPNMTGLEFLKELKTLGVDYRKIGAWYKCSKGHPFNAPDLSFRCAKYDEEFDLEKAMLETLHEYKLTEKGQHKLRFNLLKDDLNKAEDR